MRGRMAELFHDPSCVRWWLPDDEGLTPVVGDIRAFADERATPITAQSEYLRGLKDVFANVRERLVGPASDADHARDANGSHGEDSGDIGEH